MKIRLYIAAFFLLAGFSVCAQEATVERIFQEELRSKNEQVTTIKSEFSQVREMAVLASKVSKKGTFYFAKPGNMLLAFADGDYIKMTGEWFEMKNGANVVTTNVAANPAMRNLSSILSACVAGDFNKMSNGFQVSYEQTTSEWVVKLLPQRGKAASKIACIEIRFDKSDMSLNLLKMAEKNGDYTAYTFTKKQLNTTINSELFNISK